MVAIEGNEDYDKIIKDVLSNPDNLCDNLVVTEIEGEIIVIMVKPGKQLYAFFDSDRLHFLYEKLKEMKKKGYFK